MNTAPKNAANTELNFPFNKKNEAVVKVCIGQGVSQHIASIIRDLNPDVCFIVCDTTVKKLYATKISNSLLKLYPTHTIVHQPDEANKNLHTLAKISDEFFTRGGTSKSVIIALGGGITGNIAGLFASIVFRGINLVHVPTTLLAQLDSAADVKQSVNSNTLKNSLGSYKAPNAVIIDPKFLESLSDREIRAGIGEAVKHGIAQDMDFVEFLLNCDIHDTVVLEKIITHTIELKIQHWQNTPGIWNDELKVERLTHLGHTTGKVLEMMDIDYLTHGEAISHGMVIEAYMSYQLGHTTIDTAENIYKILTSLKLLYPLSKKYNLQTITDNLYAKDGAHPLFALLQDLGNPDMVSVSVPKKDAEVSIKWYLEKLATDIS